MSNSEMVPQGRGLVIHQEPIRGGLKAIREPDSLARVYGFAKTIADTELVPEHFKTRTINGVKTYLTTEQVANNVFGAALLADRMNECPFILMQNMAFIHGRPSFAGNYIINRLNMSGLIRGRLFYKTTGSGKSLSVTAYCFEAQTGERIEATVDMVMAEKEGWTTKKGNKYGTMPEQMLKYRSATFLVRANFPELLFGYQTQDEVADIHGAPEPAQVVSRAGVYMAPPEVNNIAEDLKAKIMGLGEPVAVVSAPISVGKTESMAQSITVESAPVPEVESAPVVDTVLEDTAPSPQQEEPVKVFYGYPDPVQELPTVDVQVITPEEAGALADYIEGALEGGPAHDNAPF